MLAASALIVWVALAWPAALAGAAAQALAHRRFPASPAGLRFPPGSRVEPLADRMWLNGAAMQALMFDAPVDVPELIRVLSRQQSAFSDLQILPGQAILSGWVGDALWVARMASPGAVVASAACRRSRQRPQPSPTCPPGCRPMRG
ncbi:hypothetical protein WJ972_00595 [Achromobacter insuavis]